jgi:hypothetical protein
MPTILLFTHYMLHARIESSHPLARPKEENQAQVIQRSQWFAMAVERRVIKSRIVDIQIARMIKMILASGAMSVPRQILRRTQSGADGGAYYVLMTTTSGSEAVPKSGISPDLLEDDPFELASEFPREVFAVGATSDCAVAPKVDEHDIMLWHRRLGHLSLRGVKTAVPVAIGMKLH